MSTPIRATRTLPASPNLEQQKKQARELLGALRRDDSEARRRLAESHPNASRVDPARAALHDAQLIIAREYGFASWAKLKQHIEVVTHSIDPFEELALAVKENDTAAARRLLTKHSALRTRLNEAMPGGDFGQTMIGRAVGAKNLELIDLLISHGADINQRSYWWAGGFGVLDMCAKSLVNELIERGAYVDAHAAARLGMLERLDALVTADPSVVHSRGGDGQMPLHFAANVDVARYLVDHGANLDVRDVDHESTAAQYMIRDRQDIARWLVDRGATADILMAAALGDTDRVRDQLDRDPASMNTRVDSEFFPMSNPRAGGTIYIWTLGANKMAHTVARDFGRAEVYQLLVDRMPDTMRLVMACEASDERLARELIARQPDLLARTTRDHSRRLGDMAWEGNTSAALLMLELGWPVNPSADGQASPLHQAAWIGDARVVRELIRRGANVNALESQFNATPTGWAYHGAENNGGHGDSKTVIELLRAAGGKTPDEL